MAWLVFMGWVIHRLMNGKNIPTISGKGQRFPGVGPLLTFDFLGSALELSWHWWMCHLAYANVLQ